MQIVIETLNLILGVRPKGRFDYRIGQPEPKRKKGTMLELSITNEEKIKVTLTPKTSTGKPAKLDGKPTWTVQSGESTVEPSEDGLSAYLISSDTPGVTLVAVEADADIGEGVQTISDVISLTVNGAQAANLGLTAGTPEAK